MYGQSTALLSTSQGRRPRHPWLDATSRHRYCRGRVSRPAGDLSARSVNLAHSQNYRFRYGRPVPYILISHNRKRRAQGPPLHYYIYFSKKKTAHFRVRYMLALPIFPGSHPPSIVGAYELNFCVRDGNRWTLIAINTNLFSIHPEN